MPFAGGISATVGLVMSAAGSVALVPRVQAPLTAANRRSVNGQVSENSPVGMRASTLSQDRAVAFMTPSAVTMIYVTDRVDDGRWYVYNYTSIPSTLFIVSGAAR